MTAANSGRTIRAHERPHLLIVTSDPNLADFLTEGLLLAGFWTSVVASALQTLEVFRLRTFDLVLIDASLTGLGAQELTRRLRGQSSRGGTRRTDVPILLIVDATAEERVIDPSLEFEGMLTAPLDLEEVAPRLLGVLADWRTRQADHPTGGAKSPTASGHDSLYDDEKR